MAVRALPSSQWPGASSVSLERPSIPGHRSSPSSILNSDGNAGYSLSSLRRHPNAPRSLRTCSKAYRLARPVGNLDQPSFRSCAESELAFDSWIGVIWAQIALFGGLSGPRFGGWVGRIAVRGVRRRRVPRAGPVAKGCRRGWPSRCGCAPGPARLCEPPVIWPATGS